MPIGLFHVRKSTNRYGEKDPNPSVAFLKIVPPSSSIFEKFPFKQHPKSVIPADLRGTIAVFVDADLGDPNGD
jgi:hypothetical protein